MRARAGALGGGCAARTQNVDPDTPALMYARASRPMRLPVAFHSVRLKAQLVVMGSAVLEAGRSPPGRRLMPCAASCHQSYAGKPTLGSGGVCVTSAASLSATERRPTRSAARASSPAAGSHTAHAACPATSQKPSTREPASTQRPVGPCVMRPVEAEKARLCAGADASHTAVVIKVPAPGGASPGKPATRHMPGVASRDWMKDAPRVHASLVPAPSCPQGHVYTVALGPFAKSAMSRHMPAAVKRFCFAAPYVKR